MIAKQELSLPYKLSLQNVKLNQTQHVVNEAEFLPGWLDATFLFGSGLWGGILEVVFVVQN